MLKSHIRLGAARLAYSAGLISFAEYRLRNSLTILCYHRIIPRELKESYAFPDLAVTPESFRAHCAVMARRYEVHTLSEAADMLVGGYQGKRPLAAITFDDGYRDNYLFAAPVLEAYGLKATFFIIAGLVGRSELPWYDLLKKVADYLERSGQLDACLAETPLAYLASERSRVSSMDVVQAAKRLGTAARSSLVSQLSSAVEARNPVSDIDSIMSAEELRVLGRSGHEIGSHSINHEILPLLDETARSHEILGSKELLENIMGGNVRSLCYPNGDYDDNVLKSTRESGYSYACTTRKGTNRNMTAPLELQRWFIKESALADPHGVPSSTLLRLELTGLADRFFLRPRDRRITL